MKTITVFTPTYNRAHLLPRLYESLVNQTNQDFIWMIIDDGSVDDTKVLVEKWQKVAKIDIEYHYKSNGGMHTGHNLAYKLIETELNVCIDSDDYMPSDGVENILSIWNNLTDKNSVSGIVGINVDQSDKIIGLPIPESLTRGSYFDLYKNGNAVGDKKFVLNTKRLKEEELYPEFKGEKLVPLGSLYIKMGDKNPFVFQNSIFCVVDYQVDGSSNTIFRQYKKSPKGFAYARKSNNKFIKSTSLRLKNAIHIGSSAIFAKDLRVLLENKRTIINVIVFPLSILLNLYIRIKISKK
ncbi:glycosyltransferase family A protein [Bizionia sp. KMM 8389]